VKGVDSLFKLIEMEMERVCGSELFSQIAPR